MVPWFCWIFLMALHYLANRVVSDTTENAEQISNFIEDEKSRILNSLGLSEPPEPEPEFKVPDYMLKLYKSGFNYGPGSTVRAIPPYYSKHTSISREPCDQEISIKLSYNLSSFEATHDELVMATIRLSSKVSLHGEAKIALIQYSQPYFKSGKPPAGGAAASPQMHHWRTGEELAFTVTNEVQTCGKRSNNAIPGEHEHISDCRFAFDVAISATGSPSSGAEIVDNSLSCKPMEVGDIDAYLIVVSRRRPEVTDENNHEIRRRSTREVFGHREEWKAVRRDHQKRAPLQERACKLRSMFVDFQKIGWNNWILGPPGYQANSCYGVCPYPLPDHLNPTNHAIIQTLVHSMDPIRVPAACCVPTNLTSISMLYLGNNKEIMFRPFQEMVVLHCGCR